MFNLVDLTQIILIDLSLTADNVIVVGAVVATLPLVQRKRVLAAGIGVATVLRILMAFFAVELLHITGLLLAGGVLLVWVGWKLAREYYDAHRGHSNADKTAALPPKNMTSAIWQIIVADVSMSLDNALGVAGVARNHMVELVLGLGLSVVLMGFGASFIARLSARYPKTMLVGVIAVLYTALRMIYDGGQTLGWWSGI